MIARYPAPIAQYVFSDNAKYAAWQKITVEYAMLLLDERVGDDPEYDELRMALLNEPVPTPEAVATKETTTGHDVVAFLSIFTQNLPDEVKPYIHNGLTSSDLVEFSLHRALFEHANRLSEEVGQLVSALRKDGWHDHRMIRAGRTHGQLADHTSWGHQLMVHRNAFSTIQRDMMEVAARCQVIKAPGPTGWPGANLELNLRGGRVADICSVDMVPATQIIHRDRLLAWASVYLRLACALENLALLVRLGARAEVAEVREGASRVGSSAMPHKQNPIDSEKVTGLARLARGFFTAISEDVALWEDRDLSNSSLERLAVPNLAATVEHMLTTMTLVMARLVVDEPVMRSTATRAETRTAVMQTVAQDVLGIGPVEASRLIRDAISMNPTAPDLWQHDAFSLIQEGGGDAKAWDAEVDARWAARFNVE